MMRFDDYIDNVTHEVVKLWSPRLTAQVIHLTRNEEIQCY